MVVYGLSLKPPFFPSVVLANMLPTVLIERQWRRKAANEH